VRIENGADEPGKLAEAFEVHPAREDKRHRAAAGRLYVIRILMGHFYL
jgi:hypothetical protein